MALPRADRSIQGTLFMALTVKKKLILAVKVGFSVAMLWVIFHKVTEQHGADALWQRLGGLSFGWFALAVVMMLCAVVCSVVRWGWLLKGQGIHASWGFLGASFLIARFWGAFTPGGFTGHGGWRIYDIAKHTGKTARATATIGVEMVLGQLAFGVVVMLASLYGVRFIGIRGVLLVNAMFAGIMVVGITLLARPQVFRWLARKLPHGVQAKVASLVEAVCAYQGKMRLLIQAALLGIGTHAFNNLVFVCAARALDVKLGVGEVFFGSSLQILATLLPASINGIGLREAAAVALYTRLGIPATEAVLIPIVGFAAEMLVSASGGVLFMLRKPTYRPDIHVDESDEVHSDVVESSREPGRTPLLPWHEVLRRSVASGAWAGIFIGVLEALVVSMSGDHAQHRVLFYGPVAYGVLGACLGGAGSVVVVVLQRWRSRGLLSPERLTSLMFSSVFGVLCLGLGAFRIRRDVFHEQLHWRGPKGAMVALGCVLGTIVLTYIVLTLWNVMRRAFGPAIQTFWLSAVVMAGCVLGLWVTQAHSASSAVKGTLNGGQSGQGSATKSNVLFIVVDTLRADHLPLYGYGEVRTPHLDAFAKDAVRFDQAFVNASWTRPSFASLLTGRLPSSHGVMAKNDALPDALQTLPEVLQHSGFSTLGVVTNYNVAPYFNFQQGFDEYHYLEPNFVLGADDVSAKLLLVQFLKQKIESWRAKQGRVEPGTAYQDARAVNQTVFQWLTRAPQKPWFMFVGYMDPHDPYFEHPYNGTGYARAAHLKPELNEAQRLRDLYDGEIGYWDTQFGALIHRLKADKLYDDMVIVVTSDHGEEFGEHGGFWHGTTLYDEQLRVPLLIKLPRNQRGSEVVSHWVQSIDIMPTLLLKLGLEVPKGVQGGDVFEGTDLVYAEENHEGNVLEAVRERKDSGAYKLIRANEGNPRGLNATELYEVGMDPKEKDDLASKQPQVVQDVDKTLIKASKMARHAAVRRKPINIEHDEDAAAKLKALGYMGDR